MTAMLSRIDNPFNPFEDFDSWYDYDLTVSKNESRRDTCGLLAYFVQSSPELSDKEEEDLIDDAIDEILKNDLEGIYTKVYSTTSNEFFVD